jgi:hypothetical protein
MEGRYALTYHYHSFRPRPTTAVILLPVRWPSFSPAWFVCVAGSAATWNVDAWMRCFILIGG